MKLNVGIQALAPSRWIQIEPDKRIRVRRRSTRAHQKWLQQRRHEHPQMQQLLQTFLTRLTAGEQEQPATEVEEPRAGVVGRPDDNVMTSPRGRSAALDAIAASGIDWLDILQVKDELDREEALELLEDWEGLVLDQDDEPLAFSKDAAKQLLEEEGLYLTTVDGKDALVPFGDFLVERILEAADEQDKFLAAYTESAAKNSEAPSPSSAGDGDSRTSLAASSTGS